MPDHEQIRMIYKTTYEFYLKWDKRIKTKEQWAEIAKEAKTIYRTYPFALCSDLLIHLYKILECQSQGMEKG